MSNLFFKCPYVFQWLQDLTGPNFKLTEALLAAFSQLPEVALPETRRRQPKEPWRAAACAQCPQRALLWRETSRLSTRGAGGGAVSEPRVRACSPSVPPSTCLSEGQPPSAQVTPQSLERRATRRGDRTSECPPYLLLAFLSRSVSSQSHTQCPTLNKKQL